ncbi:hypothetical protein GIB67_022859 [Kingdonia uniflora]|uniref:Uncharacterized protein n=1 Tax=Kingdonia uniflora TaxID=39325 RepID=A0A7J7P7K4_9MAGN|nr:hypothetical protein GIB67_022859 [Kingdonia uniflora]
MQNQSFQISPFIPKYIFSPSNSLFINLNSYYPFLFKHPKTPILSNVHIKQVTIHIK